MTKEKEIPIALEYEEFPMCCAGNIISYFDHLNHYLKTDRKEIIFFNLVDALSTTSSCGFSIIVLNNLQTKKYSSWLQEFGYRLIAQKILNPSHDFKTSVNIFLYREQVEKLYLLPSLTLYYNPSSPIFKEYLPKVVERWVKNADRNSIYSGTKPPKLETLQKKLEKIQWKIPTESKPSTSSEMIQESLTSSDNSATVKRRWKRQT